MEMKAKNSMHGIIYDLPNFLALSLNENNGSNVVMLDISTPAVIDKAESIDSSGYGSEDICEVADKEADISDNSVSPLMDKENFDSSDYGSEGSTDINERVSYVADSASLSPSTRRGENSRPDFGVSSPVIENGLKIHGEDSEICCAEIGFLQDSGISGYRENGYILDGFLKEHVGLNYSAMEYKNSPEPYTLEKPPSCWLIHNGCDIGNTEMCIDIPTHNCIPPITPRSLIHHGTSLSIDESCVSVNMKNTRIAASGISGEFSCDIKSNDFMSQPLNLMKARSKCERRQPVEQVCKIRKAKLEIAAFDPDNLAAGHFRMKTPLKSNKISARQQVCATSKKNVSSLENSVAEMGRKEVLCRKKLRNTISLLPKNSSRKCSSSLVASFPVGMSGTEFLGLFT